MGHRAAKSVVQELLALDLTDNASPDREAWTKIVSKWPFWVGWKTGICKLDASRSALDNNLWKLWEFYQLRPPFSYIHIYLLDVEINL